MICCVSLTHSVVLAFFLVFSLHLPLSLLSLLTLLSLLSRSRSLSHVLAVVVAFVHAQRGSSMDPLHLLLGGVIYVAGLSLGVGLNVRWQRLNKDADYTSTDIVRFFMEVTAFFYLYPVIGANWTNNTLMASAVEWHLICFFHGFVSGPLLAYGRSIIAESSMLGYEGMYVGFMAAASSLLSLVAPTMMEIATRSESLGDNLGGFFFYPMLALIAAYYIWKVKIDMDKVRNDNKTYIATIASFDARKEEFRAALHERSRRRRVVEEKKWVDDAKKLLLDDVHYLEWEEENPLRTERRYQRAREVLVRHYEPCPCECCARDRCWCTRRVWCPWMYTKTGCYSAIRRWRVRKDEVREGEKLLSSWKKEDATKGKILLSLVYNDMVERNEKLTLRRRSKWVKSKFFPEGEPPIVKSARERGKEEWEKKLEKDQKAQEKIEQQWEKEEKEDYFFSKDLLGSEVTKWGLDDASDSSSSEESSDDEEET